MLLSQFLKLERNIYYNPTNPGLETNTAKTKAITARIKLITLPP
jgi:hypothetical protein